MSRYIVTRVSSFSDDEIKWEVTDAQYWTSDAEGKPTQQPKVIATFIDPATAQNFITWKSASDEKFEKGIKDFSERYGDALSHLTDDDKNKFLIKAVKESEEHKGRDSDCG